MAYALNVADNDDSSEEPSTYSKAVSCKDADSWIRVMHEEMESLQKTDTYNLVSSIVQKNDYNNVFSHVVKHSSIRSLLGIVTLHDFEL